MRPELSKGQMTRVADAAKKWKKRGLDSRNILRHLQKKLRRFKVDWLAVARALDEAR
jgi:hypothetical protein